MGQFKTPLVSKFRKDSATLYTFGSAVEDIGLNINERNNKVRFSNYVLLNIPNIVEKCGGEGTISVDRISLDSSLFFRNESQEEISTYHDYVFSSMIQDYVLNFETRLRNQGTYDFNLSQTVTEKIFWKWLQKTGAIKFQKSTTTAGDVYYHEDLTTPESTIIKGFGQVSTSSQASNSYNMNNETYVLIPSSYGQMKYFLTENFDSNYVLNKTYISTNYHYLEGYTTTSIIAGEDFMYKAYTDDASNFGYIVKNEYEGLQFEFDIKDIRKYIKNESIDYESNPTYYDRITYDNIAIDSSLCLADKYDFNTILLYYSIYDKNDNILATNLFGVMVLDSTTQSSSLVDYKISFDELTQFNREFEIKNLEDCSIYQSEKYDGFDKSVEMYFKKPTSQSPLSVYFQAEGKNSGFEDVSTLSIRIASSNIKNTNVYIYSTPKTETHPTFDIYNGNLYDILISQYSTVDNNTFYTLKLDSSTRVTGTQRYLGIEIYPLETADSDVKVYLSGITYKYYEDASSQFKTVLSIPSYTKTKTTEGSFGSEYSFRINMQTASIYDSSTQLIDYSTAESATLNDFNNVISNLRTSVDILKNNSVVLANVYTDTQSTKQLVTNALTKVDTMEKNVNDLMYGNVREISANIIDTNNLSARNIDTSINFIDLDTSTSYGKIDGSVLYYQNIDTSSLSMSKIELSTLQMKNEGFEITTPTNVTALKIDVNGNIYFKEQGDLKANNLSVKNIDTSINFVNLDTSVSYGKIDGSLFSYQKIDTSSLSLDNITLSTLQMKESVFEFLDNNDKSVLKIDDKDRTYLRNSSRWLFICQSENEKTTVRELFVYDKLDEIIAYIEDQEGVISYSELNLSYSEYLKYYWSYVLEFERDKLDTEVYASQLINPTDSFEANIIFINSLNTEEESYRTFTTAKYEFNESVTNEFYYLNNEITLKVNKNEDVGEYLKFNTFTVSRFVEIPISESRDDKILELKNNPSWIIRQ